MFDGLWYLRGTKKIAFASRSVKCAAIHWYNRKMIKREVYQQPSESCVSSISSDVPILATNVSTLSAYSSVIITLLSINLSGKCI